MNQIIFDKYYKKIKINENSLEKQQLLITILKIKNMMQLSEIVIGNEKDINLKNEFYKYIEQFGFKIAANKYGKSDASKYGG